MAHVLLALSSATSGPTSRLIVIGATNFPNRLDEALVRPGRLNRIVHIERPDVPAIAGILRQHLGGDLAGENLMPLASIGTGATGADIAGWARGARMAARAAGRAMILADLVDQVAQPETRSPAVLKAVATHEASHCLGAEFLFVGAVQTVSIVSRGGYAGRTDAKLRNFESLTADEIDAYVVSVLCGRAADERWGAASSGSAGGPRSDLAIATATVAAKHATYGLGGSLLYRGGNAEAVQLIDKDPDFRALVEADLHRLYDVAQSFVAEHAERIERLARRLVEAKVLGGAEARAIIAEPPTTPAGATAAEGGPHA